MKTALCVMVVLVSIVSFSDEIDQELKELSTAPASYEVAGKWFKLSKKIEQEGLRQEVLKASAAAVICANKYDVYVKRIRPEIQNNDVFDGEFFDQCAVCRGTGKQDIKCIDCKGAKRCTHGNCNNGKTVVHRMSGNVVSKCSKCKGTGLCQKCGGKGSVSRLCSRCDGSKKIINKERLMAVYQKHAQAAAKWKQEREREEQERRVAVEKAQREETLRANRRKQGEQERKTMVVKAPKSTMLESCDDRYDYSSDGCATHESETIGYIYAKENGRGGMTLGIAGRISKKSKAESLDNEDAALAVISFPSEVSQKQWKDALEKSCRKMVSWVETAEANKVTDLKKPIPDDTFNGGPVHACYDLIGRSEYTAFTGNGIISMLSKRDIGSNKFANSSVPIEFVCVIHSRYGQQSESRMAELLVRSKGGPAIKLVLVRGKNTDEIREATKRFLEHVDPASMIAAWNKQAAMIPHFPVAGDVVLKHVGVNEETLVEAKRRYKIMYDGCACAVDAHCAAVSVKSIEGDWNYALVFDYNGSRRGKGYQYDKRFVVITTDEMRKRFSDALRLSCGQMMEWLVQASRNQVKTVSKQLPFDGAIQAYHNVITKGLDQDELLSTALRYPVSKWRSEMGQGNLISFSCDISRESSEDDSYVARLTMHCAGEFSIMMLKAVGTLENINGQVKRFLARVDPEYLIKAYDETIQRKKDKDALFK